ncbi:MAG: insulinase family protein [Dehalococcoidales bacterium]|nr:insulinase family protein [Dehalococcoidales bacterium]
MYHKTTLDNGLRLITATMPHTRSVCISIFIGTGSRYEPDAEAGISHFIEHLLFKGTEKRPSAREISAAIEGVGGIINGATDKEVTVYWAKVPGQHFATALDILTDILLHPRFEPADLEKERQVIIEEINMTRDIPSQQVNLLIDELLWPDHPLGRDIAGSRESVTATSRDNLISYLKRQYGPDNTVVAIAGNIRHRETVSAVSEILSGWASQQPHLGYTAFQPKPGPRLRIEKKDTEQVHLCLAIPGLPLLHPRRFPLDLLNVILGEGMSSRLFTEIRERLGLTYSIHSYVEHFFDTGSLNISAGVELRKLETATSAIREQLHQLKEGVPEEELIRAKEFSKGRLLLRMEDSRSVAGWLGGQEILTERILTTDQIIAIIDAITTEELKELARELIADSKLHLAVVGPVTEDEPLAKLLAL